MKRYRSIDETREILRDFHVLDEAAFEEAVESGEWAEDVVPLPAVCVGHGAYGWHDLELAAWSMDHGVGVEAHTIVGGPTGHAKTSLMSSLEEQGVVFQWEQANGTVVEASTEGFG